MNLSDLQLCSSNERSFDGSREYDFGRSVCNYKLYCHGSAELQPNRPTESVQITQPAANRANGREGSNGGARGSVSSGSGIGIGTVSAARAASCVTLHSSPKLTTSRQTPQAIGEAEFGSLTKREERAPVVHPSVHSVEHEHERNSMSLMGGSGKVERAPWTQGSTLKGGEGSSRVNGYFWCHCCFLPSTRVWLLSLAICPCLSSSAWPASSASSASSAVG